MRHQTSRRKALLSRPEDRSTEKLHLLLPQRLAAHASLATLKEPKNSTALFSTRLCPSEKQYAFEGLSRWSSMNLGIISPSQFVPIAEAANLADKLSGFMLRQCAETYPLCQEQEISLDKISLNILIRLISSRHFVSGLLSDAEKLGIPSDTDLVGYYQSD